MQQQPLSQLEQPRPPAIPSREEVANREVGHTTVGPGTVRLLVWFFLALVVAVPIIEWTGVRALRARGEPTAWSHLADLGDRLNSQLARARETAAAMGLWHLIVSTNRTVLAALSGFERVLEDESVLGHWLRPPAQLAMTRWLGAGNERVYPGRDGWLFYRPDVEYITSRGFLDRDALRRRIVSASEWDAPPQPDPRPAIARFSRDLQARGITLVVLPTPLKPGVHPDKLALEYANAEGVLQNPSYRAFVEDLRRDGTLVFDPSDALAAARRLGPQYLDTDTHWRPETMEEVAQLLASFISTHVRLPDVSDPEYLIERQEMRSTGDTARMLDLPEGAPLYPAEAVWLRRVLQNDGSLWRSSRQGDVLLLGDSFTNIYSLESMGWGTGAGLAEQLSYTLRRPLDRLVQNDQASFATRAMLAKDPARLDGKRVVIYQFAARELTFGDWKVLPLPSTP
jgi:hypothetical protein